MDDDSPDDVALRTLARQLFGDHGLGRDTAGERVDGALDQRRRHPRVLRRPLPHGEHDRRRRRRRRPRRDRRRGRRGVRRDAGRRRPGRPGRAGRWPSPTSPSTTTPSRSTWRSAGARCPATIPTARRSTSSTTSSAAVCRAGCSTRSASAAASPTACTRRVVVRRRRRLVGVRRGDARARRRGRPADHQGARPPRRRRRSPTTSWTIAIGYLTGAYEMGLEDTGARMSRLGGMLATLGYVHPRRRADRPLGASDPRRRAPRHRPRLRRAADPVTVVASGRRLTIAERRV